MRQFTWTLGLLVLVTVYNSAECRTIVKRQLADGYGHGIEPGHGEHHVEGIRDKKKVEVKWGIKNALLGFVFNKINQFIDQKTHWVAQLDKQNIAKNIAHGIEAPKDPVVSLTGIITDAVGQKLQAAGPFLGVAIQKITSGSGGLLGGASGGGHGGGGFNIGSLLGGLSGGSGGPSAKLSYTTYKPRTTTKRITTTEDTIIFEKHQPVSIDVPPELFNNGFQLITNVSKRVGDFMLDSGFRAHRLLESMRPFIWKLFGKNGLVIEATTDKPIFTDPNEKPST